MESNEKEKEVVKKFLEQQLKNDRLSLGEKAAINEDIRELLGEGRKEVPYSMMTKSQKIRANRRMNADKIATGGRLRLDILRFKKVVKKFGARRIANILGVNERTVRRWAASTSDPIVHTNSVAHSHMILTMCSSVNDKICAWCLKETQFPEIAPVCIDCYDKRIKPVEEVRKRKEAPPEKPEIIVDEPEGITLQVELREKTDEEIMAEVEHYRQIEEQRKYPRGRPFKVCPHCHKNLKGENHESNGKQQDIH